MSEQGQMTAQMDAALAGMADLVSQRRLAADARPTVVAVQSTPVTSIGAMAVAKRLEALIKQAADLTKQAELLATALAGPDEQPRGTSSAAQPAQARASVRQADDGP